MSKDRGEANRTQRHGVARRASPRGGRLLGPGNLPRLLCRLLCCGGCALEPWRDSLQGSGVLSAFGLLLVKQGGFDPKLAAELRRLFELRSIADYMMLDDIELDDYAPIDAARRFVDGVKRWLNGSAT